jgi:antitoxin component YwqK of YwqJK toxin-antitoxin module
VRPFPFCLAMKPLWLLLFFPFALLSQQPPPAQAAGLAPFGPRIEPYRTFFADGGLQAEGYRYLTFDTLGNPIRGFVDHLGQYTEFLLDSLNVEYWPNGRRRRADMYRRGVRQGPHQEWHENGVLAENGTYDGNRKTGLWQVFYPSGAPSYRANLQDGLLHGLEQQWHPNERMKSEVLYQKGLRQGEARYYCPNGLLQISVNYERDRETGSQYQYYCDGRRKSVVTFSGNEMYLEQFWDPKGEQLVLDGYGVLAGYDSLKREFYEINYDMGQKNGVARFWYPDGSLKRTGNYLNDLETGEWLFYAENGLVFDRGSFLRGIRTDLRVVPRKE